MSSLLPAATLIDERIGSSVAGFDVGIICLRTTHALLPGNVQHARSYPFPVVYGVVEIDDPWRLMAGDEALVEPVVEAARSLRRCGVKAICGACGSFGFYQRAVAAAVDIPVFLTPLMMAPMLLLSMAPRKKLGVVCGAADAIDCRLREASGLRDDGRLAYAELARGKAFQAMVAGGSGFNLNEFRVEVMTTVRKLVSREPELGALLLQCSDVPPFGAGLQEATGLPVFDMTRLIAWVQAGVHYRGYKEG